MVGDRDRAWIDSMPDAYERYLVPTVFRPFAVELAERVAGLMPARVLELAAGTGVLTRELVPLGFEVVATDLNQAMVDCGKAQAPGAEWRQADAMALPFDADGFDVVVCQFGAMFFPDKRAAFAEARRVLRPGGALLFSTWAGVADHDFQRAVVAGLERAFPDAPPTFIVSVPHGYSRPDQIISDVRAAGLSHVEAVTVTVEGHARSAAEVVEGYCSGTPLRGELEARGDVDATIAIVVDEVERQLGSGAVTGRMSANVITATEVPSRP